ncbi:hypothetical protein ACJX0J_005714, partial [Zea mays]
EIKWNDRRLKSLLTVGATLWVISGVTVFVFPSQMHNTLSPWSSALPTRSSWSHDGWAGEPAGRGGPQRLRLRLLLPQLPGQDLLRDRPVCPGIVR